MNPFEMVIALGGIGLVGFFIAKFTGLIKTWINRNNTGIDEEEFDRLAQAFIEHKKNTQRRLENLEAIISEQDNNEAQKTVGKQQERIEPSERSIEIEEPKPEKGKTKSGDSNLRNMLRE